MEAYESRLQSFTKARRVKQSTAKRAVSLKWPHSAHFIATPDTLTEAGFFFNPSWDARDNVECYLCGKCLDGWEEQDDPFALHWDKCRDTCAWAVLRCGLNDDVDRKGNFTFKDAARQPDGKPMEKARLATFRLNNSWPHDRVKGHGANSTKMAKAGFAFTPQTPGDDTGTCLYCRVSLSGWDDDDDPLEEHRKRVKKSNLSCPFFPEASGPKSRSRTTSLRSTAQPKSRAGSRQPRPAASETSASHSDDDSRPAPSRPAQRSRTTSIVSASKERDASDVLRRSTRSSRAKPPPEVEGDASSTELSKSTVGQSRSKSSGKGKGKGTIEAIEEADEDDITRAVLPTKQRVKGKENVAHDAKVPRPTRHAKTLRANETEEEARPSKCRPPKKGKAALDEREESSPDVDSESDVRPVAKRRNRIVESVSYGEAFPQETKPDKWKAPMKIKEVSIDVLEPQDDRIDEIEDPSCPIKKTLPKGRPRRQTKTRTRGSGDRNEGSDDESPQVEGTEKSLPSLDRVKDKAQSRSIATLESTETAASSSEEAVIPLPAPVKKSRIVKGKGPKSSVTASHPERCRSRTTSDSNDPSKPLVSEGDDVHTDMVDIELDAAPVPAAVPARKAEETAPRSGSKLVLDMDDRALPPPIRSFRSPECPEPGTSQRDATPPPPSSSLLSVSSTTSTTKVEGQTDTETLIETLPERANGVQLAEEERMMTVEQWIRCEIEVQYERLKRDGEAKIRLFRERAEEVRRQIEAL